MIPVEWLSGPEMTGLINKKIELTDKITYQIIKAYPSKEMPLTK